MNNVYKYVCDNPNIHIVVDITGARLALITLFYDNKPAISRKYLFKKADQEKANKLVIAFCTLFSEGTLRDIQYEREEDASDFFESLIRDSLKKVYTKIGLLLWSRN